MTRGTAIQIIITVEITETLMIIVVVYFDIASSKYCLVLSSSVLNSSE